MRLLSTPVRVFTVLGVLLGAASVGAQSGLPLTRVRLDSPAEFRALSANWELAGDLAGNPRSERALAPLAGTDLLVCNPGQDTATRGHLFTAWEHGDLELELEFLLTPRSNSGVYLQGRYEIQLFDSWGVRTPTSAHCGGIYVRWDPARGKDREGFEGHAPRANAGRAPGLWQKLRIEFRAPRFDASGKKTRNARFVKVALNGFTIHENVEVTGPTRSAAFTDEQPLGPLMIQGDHGPVAVRNLAVKRFEPGAVIAVENIRYKLYAGDFKTIGAYDQLTPKSEGALDRFALGAVEPDGKFALVFTGTLNAPREGSYRFAVESGSMAGLTVDGRPVVAPLDRGGQPGIVKLTPGPHAFRADLVHTTNARASFGVFAEGPQIAPHALTARERAPSSAGRAPTAGASRSRELIVEPEDRVLVQRGFVPFAPRKRLYAATVGSPAGAHFAYDFETAAILHVWRGVFVDTLQMWEGRGNDQTAKPAGASLTFTGKPAVAMIENAADGDWPDHPDALWSSQGYTLEADGTPTFLSTLADLSIHDRIVSLRDGRGVARRLRFSGKLPAWSTWVLLAESETITPQPGGVGWIVGERTWYLDWPNNSTLRPVLRTVNGRQQLAVRLTAQTLDQPVTYSIVW